MLRIKEKRDRLKRFLTAWNTGAETALCMAGKRATPHRAEAAMETCKTEKGVSLYRTRAYMGLYRAEKRAALHRIKGRVRVHGAEIQTETRRADREKSRKSGSP